MRLAQVLAYGAIGGAFALSRDLPDHPPTLGDVIMGSIVILTIVLLLSRDQRHGRSDAAGREQADRSIPYRAGKIVQRLRRNLT